jgi:PKD repeat protein
VVAGTRHFLQIPVSAVDAEGDPILSLTAAPLPPGATFTVGHSNQSGLLEWTPTDLQIGTYDVTFTASNLESRSTTTRITVIFANSPPGLNPVDGMTLREGSTADQVLSGFDLDGDPLNFQLIGAPPFASISPIDGSSATLHLSPDYGSAGSYVATVQMDDGHGGTASAPVAIVVEHQNRGPVLSAPASASCEEGDAISIPIEASDPDGDVVTLGALNQPVGSLFVDHGDATGTFSWTPGYEQAGTYVVTFTACDNLDASSSPWDLTITVADRNRGPVASAGGPYAGVINVPIDFDGTGSSDPDGSALTYRWDFGDLASATGAVASHAYAAGGIFAVVLTVSDGGLSAQANASATVQDVFAARAFVEQPNRTIRLVSAKATWCAEVEPTENSFLMNAVLPSTVVMRYGDRQIAAIADRVGFGADLDANGVAEMTICFTKNDLRSLLTGLPKGASTVNVTLEGKLATGGTFRTALLVDVTSSGGALTALLSPNPLNPSGVLTFTTSRQGRVRVTVFDLRGRLVRTILPAQELGAGYHDVLLDGRNDRGESLSSGAYFYRIEAAEGVAAGRFVLLK